MSLTAAEELELLQLLEDEERYQAANDYYEYVKYVHAGMYGYTRHGEYVCRMLNDAMVKRKKMFAGEIQMEIQYIQISMPPQHGKSMHITETLPSFFLGHFPDHGVIEISYNEGYAEKFGGKNKDKVERHGPELFGIDVAGDTRSKSEWAISKDGKKTRGGMISRGIMSGVTGSSWGDCIIVDDPIKNREEANSETIRNKHWAEWQDSLSTRIHPGAIVIIIMTRWHEDDLCGRLRNPEYANPLPWQIVNLPLEAEEYDQLGRAPGEPLWPEQYGYDFIAVRKTYPSSFNALYQGRPTSQEGNMLKRDWWQYYDVLPPIASKLISIDAAFKDNDDSDFVVIQVWGKNRANMYLIDQVRARMNFKATVQSIRNMHIKHPDAAWKLIEDKANGSAIISTLHSEIGGIIPINPEGGKVARVNAVSAFIESGNVFLPRRAEWIHDFVEEAASFPNGKHDDQVDAMSQALNRFIYFSGDIPESNKQVTPFPFRTDEPSGGEYVSW
ncbi:phage terminase large subunit [Paenibacillus taiwanensis]|uniref:phage terminase large subunit n=1 Tax=Paenibacillus taiwanensis TaxID=401638 RepID=UPI00041C0492|nr:phage terminase large subunit [Paenibacillus taiwanensis]